MTPHQRDKIIRFATAYGQSAGRLSKRLGIPVDEVQTVVNAFLKQHPNVRAWRDKIKRKDQ